MDSDHKCRECGTLTLGVFLDIAEDNATGYIPDLCLECLNIVLLKQDDSYMMFCKKCDNKVPVLRDDECIECYFGRTDEVMKLPMEIKEIPPPLPATGQGEAYLKYNVMNCRNYDGKEQ